MWSWHFIQETRALGGSRSGCKPFYLIFNREILISLKFHTNHQTINKWILFFIFTSSVWCATGLYFGSCFVFINIVVFINYSLFINTDDTPAVFTGNDPINIQDRANKLLAELNQWFSWSINTLQLKTFQNLLYVRWHGEIQIKFWRQYFYGQLFFRYLLWKK